jgi:hypothetical protein
VTSEKVCACAWAVVDRSEAPSVSLSLILYLSLSLLCLSLKSRYFPPLEILSRLQPEDFRWQAERASLQTKAAPLEKAVRERE